MYNTAKRNRTPRVYRNSNFFAPSFGNIINEILNSPISEVASEKQKRYTHPPANVVKEEGKYILALALPGVSKKDVIINIEKGKLTIKSNVDEKSDVKYRLREFNYAKFERVFNLSENADTDNISASFDNGILNITIPISKEAGPFEVKIK